MPEKLRDAQERSKDKSSGLNVHGLISKCGISGLFSVNGNYIDRSESMYELASRKYVVVWLASTLVSKYFAEVV